MVFALDCTDVFADGFVCQHRLLRSDRKGYRASGPLQFASRQHDNAPTQLNGILLPKETHPFYALPGMETCGCIVDNSSLCRFFACPKIE